VGYGNIAPKTTASNFLSAFEAMVGLMGFAMATGLLYGRFSRPSARIGFSPNMLVAPYRGGTSLQFRILNQRANLLMEVEAKVLLMTVEGPQNALERCGVQFLPLTWTVVHPIDGESPLAGRTPADLESLQAELLILIKGYDDTFSQTVHTRYSYRYDELLWGQRFAPAFHVDRQGDLVLDTDKVGALAPGELSPRSA
jgi:inward rectifier potassium channel